MVNPALVQTMAKMSRQIKQFGFIMNIVACLVFTRVFMMMRVGMYDVEISKMDKYPS
jgi:uncharacterized membrane protein YqhA